MKKTALFEGAVTVPNLLSLIRIALIPVFAVLFYRGEQDKDVSMIWWSVFVLAVSGMTDFFDGKIARRFNQISNLGKVLDPAADKLTQVTIAVMLFLCFLRSDVPQLQAFAWVFLLFLAKEVFMMIAAVIMLFTGYRPIPAEIFGKISTFSFYVIMTLIIAFGPEVGAVSMANSDLTLPIILVEVLVIVSAILTFVALFSYFPSVWRQLQEIKAKKREEAANSGK